MQNQRTDYIHTEKQKIMKKKKETEFLKARKKYTSDVRITKLGYY